MIDPSILELLVCPETKQPVTLMSSDEIAALNEAIVRGTAVTSAGMKCSAPIEAALVRSDRKVAYPIIKSIPVLLPGEGIVL